MRAATLTDTPFSEWLRREMHRRGFDDNQSKLATYLETRASTVNAWFTRGARPSYEMSVRLAAVLKVPVEEVLAAGGYQPQEGTPNPDELPQWADLIVGLSRADQEYVGRLVETLAQKPVQPDEQPGQEEP